MRLAATPTPLPEQRKAVELFALGQGLRINAYAGTGKTTTLRLLAENTQARGVYVAFNRSIAAEAAAKFPSRVSCATAHSIAFRGIKRKLGLPDWKLTGSLTPKMVNEAFRMPAQVSFACGMVLDRQSYGTILLKALSQFLQSAANEPDPSHVTRQGFLETLSPAMFQSFSQQATEHVRAIWGAMQYRQGGLPLGHDGYLKLWALSKPQANADYILVDESQDMNPVLLDVLKRVSCPVVYVGDAFQQIYEWRGAVNAMDALPSTHSVLLAQSFRFGEEIAAAATVILRSLRAKAPLRGNPSLESHLAPVRPDVILSRSNTGAIGNILSCLRRNIPCAVVGGTKTLRRLLEGVLQVQQGLPAQTVELLGFQSWSDVMSFSRTDEGQYLKSLVNLVQEHGADRMLSAIQRCEETEATAQIVCSTAHRSKGRQWKYVHLDHDFENGFLRAGNSPEGTSVQEAMDAERRLLYVALTRASHAVSLPLAIRQRFGLQNSTAEVLSDGAPATRIEPYKVEG